jgi:hypothetical protein
MQNRAIAKKVLNIHKYNALIALYAEKVLDLMNKYPFDFVFVTSDPDKIPSENELEDCQYCQDQLAVAWAMIEKYVDRKNVDKLLDLAGMS